MKLLQSDVLDDLSRSLGVNFMEEILDFYKLSYEWIMCSYLSTYLKNIEYAIFCLNCQDKITCINTIDSKNTFYRYIYLIANYNPDELYKMISKIIKMKVLL